MPLPLYPRRKSPWYPLDRRLGGPQSRSGCCGEDKNLELQGNDFYIIRGKSNNYLTLILLEQNNWEVNTIYYFRAMNSIVLNTEG
jgi:hypothetical protein